MRLGDEALYREDDRFEHKRIDCFKKTIVQRGYTRLISGFDCDFEFTLFEGMEVVRVTQIAHNSKTGDWFMWNPHGKEPFERIDTNEVFQNRLVFDRCAVNGNNLERPSWTEDYIRVNVASNTLELVFANSPSIEVRYL
jgi:hypothetical protein